MDEQATRQEANDLYWESDLSVNRIAEKLELSKGRLYELIDSLPTGLSCPMCGGEARYPNRTAKERATVLCPECEFEGKEDELVHPDTEHEDFGDQVAAAVGAGRTVSSRRVFWGAVFLGAAAGLALFRRRRKDA